MKYHAYFKRRMVEQKKHSVNISEPESDSTENKNGVTNTVMAHHVVARWDVCLSSAPRYHRAGPY